MPSKPSDDVLVEQLLVLRAQLGGREAFARLVHRHDGPLLFYLRRLMAWAPDAEDVRQEVWLTVLRRLHGLQDPGAFRAWLYRIARHRAISWLRHRRLEVPLDGTGALEQVAAESGDAEEDPTFTVEEAAAVYAALDTLSAAHREILTLRFLGGLSYQDIAAVLDCGVGTVRSRLHYARRALRAAVSRFEAGAGGDSKRRTHS